MLVATSTVARHEDTATKYVHEEHLLERISVLENHLSQLADKVGQTLDLLLRQAKTAHLDQTLLESLIEVLGESKLISGARLRSIWNERSREEVVVVVAAADDSVSKVWQATRDKLLEEFGAAAELASFSLRLGEAIELIAAGKIESAAAAFEKAALLDPHNDRLNLMIGRILFAARRFAVARSSLERAHQANPLEPRSTLLLGLIVAEQGELKKAYELFSASLRLEKSYFASHCAKGLLRALQGEWSASLTDFKRAHALKPGAASFFLIGIAYYARSNYTASLKALIKATVLAPDQAVIAYLRGLVLLRLKERQQAREWFQLSSRLDARCPLYRAASRRPSLKTASLPELFVGTKSRRRLKLSERAKFISEAIFVDALGVGIGAGLNNSSD
ncbi:MAG: tetratricopeptide repeat protein [Pyrinomonadaceae bacterium]